jgi:hypothetical protein
MVRAAVIDRQIAEWFSPSTYVAWSEAHKFISWRGLPKEASEYDYSEAKTRALDAIAGELRSELPKKKGTYPKHSSASGVGPVGTPPVAGDPWAQQSSTSQAMPVT